MILVFGLSSGAFLTLFVDTNDKLQFADGSPTIKAIWALIYLVAIRNILKRRGQFYTLLRANKSLVLLTILPLLSVTWSVEPSATFHQASTLLLSAMVAVDLSMRYTLRRQLELLRITLVCLIAMSVLVELTYAGDSFHVSRLDPSAGMESSWQKITLGKMTCLAVIACLAVPRGLLRNRFAVVVAGLVVAVFSASVSAVGYLAVFAFTPRYGMVISNGGLKPRRVALIFCADTLFASCVYIRATSHSNHHDDGKGPSFNRQSGFVGTVVEASAEARPLLGYGYSAFWSQGSRPARIIREEVHWDDAPHSHNGYIERCWLWAWWVSGSISRIIGSGSAGLQVLDGWRRGVPKMGTHLPCLRVCLSAD